MNRIWGNASVVLICLALSVSVGALAEEKHKFSFKAPPGATKYTESHVLDVGDRPGHQLRIAELVSRYPGEAPQFAGVKAREVWTRLVSDYTEGSGSAFSYQIYMMETGDRIFARSEILMRTAVGPDGLRVSSFTTVQTLTGGTGRFKGIRGTLRSGGFTDFKTGTTGTQTDGEYWFEN